MSTRLYPIPVQQQQHQAFAQGANGAPAVAQPAGVPGVPPPTPGVRVTPGTASLPTEQQLRDPYNTVTDPNRPGSVEDHIQEQQRASLNPQEQGARLAAARLEQQQALAAERATYLEQQIAQMNQNSTAQAQTVAALQQQIAANAQANQAPAVDPLAQYALTAEERELAGDQLGIVEKIAARAATEARIAAKAEFEQQLAAMQTQFGEQLQPLQQQTQQTAEQIQQDWNNSFVGAVHQEMGFDIRSLQSDPTWQAFAAQTVPFTGGVTYGQQLANFISARDTQSALELTRAFKQQRDGQYSPGADPAVQAGVPASPAARQTATTPPPSDPAAQMQADVAEFRRLEQQLGRGQINIADFARLTKPIDDRLRGLPAA